MNELLTLSRLARRLRIPAKWLKAEADAGRLPHLKAGPRYLFNAWAVQEALAAKAANGCKGVARA